MKTTLLYAGMCCLLGIAGGCVAAPRGHAADSSTLTQVVRFADLDIQNAAGAEALYRRIRYAAQAVCPLPADLGHLVAQRACVNHAIDQAVRTVNSAALTRLRFGADYRLASK
ncbi:MAG: UrcA family protein [Steroidobacteraceae bacterium]|jgi:UrcA family protein